MKLSEVVIVMRFSSAGETLSNAELVSEGERLLAYCRENQAYMQKLGERRSQLARLGIDETLDETSANLVAHAQSSRDAASAIEARFGLNPSLP